MPWEDAAATGASIPETAGRVGGLTGRALIGGAAGLASLPFRAAAAIPDATSYVTNPIRNAFGLDTSPVTPMADSSGPYTPQLSDFVHPEKWQEAAQYFADHSLGTPQPQTPGERVYSRAVEALPSAALAPEAPIAGALSAAAGGAASQGVAEAGGSPTAQFVAGLAGGSVPVLGSLAGATTRGIVRGASGTAMQANIDNAAASGIPLTVGQASGSGAVQKLEAASGKLWGGGAIEDAAQAQTQGLSSHVSDIVDKLNQSGTDLTPTGAGATINTGVAAAKQSMKGAEKAAYDNVDKLVPPATPINVSGTLAKLDTLATPTPGAENTTAALIPKTISDLRDNMQADAANGTMPYSALAATRTRIGNSIDWGFSASDPVSNAALKQVYGALTDDLNAGAAAVSPQAQAAVTNARALYAANQTKRDLLNGIVDKAAGPEAVYTAATSGMKNGATKIGGIMMALDPDSQNVVRATVLNKLGLATTGPQKGSFNAATFLNNWVGMSDAAKNALFGTSGQARSLRAGLDSLTSTMQTLNNAKALVNPSGTAAAAGHSWGLWSLLGEASTAALTGHVGLAAASLGGGLSATAANAILSRALTNPRVVQWMAQSTKLPIAALPNAINQLARLGQAKNDPDASNLAAYLQQQNSAQ
jgi:hypothetical protein